MNTQNHFLQLKNAEFTENLTAEITKCEELENKFDDVSKFKNGKEKLETLLLETQFELQVGVICKQLIQNSYKITSPLHFTGLHGGRWRQGVQENRALLGVEQMDAEELLAQKKLSNEAVQLEDLLAEVWQTGPINKEMRNLITSLQTHNIQLKGEVASFKWEFKKKEMEISKFRKEKGELK